MFTELVRVNNDRIN